MKKLTILLLGFLLIGFSQARSQEIWLQGGTGVNFELNDGFGYGHTYFGPYIGVSYLKAINPRVYFQVSPRFTIMDTAWEAGEFNGATIEGNGYEWRNSSIETQVLISAPLLGTRFFRVSFGPNIGIPIASKYSYQYNPTSSGDPIQDMFDPNFDENATAIEELDIDQRTPYFELNAGLDLRVSKFTVGFSVDYRLTDLSPKDPPFYMLSYSERVSLLGLNINAGYRLK